MGDVLSYFQALTDAMTILGEREDTIFVGQAIVYGGQRAAKTFDGVPPAKKIEFPVAEDLQMGFCLGLALAGYLPVCFYPRFDFLLLAANQLVNHLDKLPLVTQITPKIIIRVAVGAKEPLDAGPQHTQNYSRIFREMLQTVNVVELWEPGQVYRGYDEAIHNHHATILVEYMDRY